MDCADAVSVAVAAATDSKPAADVAATLAQGLIGALTAVWQYYLSIVLGLIALVAAISQSSIRLTQVSRFVITIAVIIFGIVNFRSIDALTSQLNELAKVIKLGAPELRTALKDDLPTNVLWLHPAGLALSVIWLWLFDRHDLTQKLVARFRKPVRG